MMMKRFRVKICGMTQLDDALCAASAGVDALGFIFYARSPRSISLQAAKDIIAKLPPFVDRVGVFVNTSPEEMARHINECGLTYAQLHGDEAPADCEGLLKLAPRCKLIKALRVGVDNGSGSTQTTKAFTVFAPYVSGFLLDTYAPNAHGGTGHTFDWSLIPPCPKPLLLAGGLTVENIVAALRQTNPYGVDYNSGLEDAPGKKNHDKIKTFLRQVREYEHSLLSGK